MDTQVSKERVKEMYDKIAALAEGDGPVNDGKFHKDGATGRSLDLPLGDVSVGDVLLALGIAKDKSEAKAFMVSVLKSSLAVTVLGLDHPINAMFDLVKFGLFLGIQVGKVRDTKGAV